MKLSFFGAARQVTGSMFMLELEHGYKVLIDCGADLSKRNLPGPLFPFQPSEIDLVLLTHAHLDHSGNIPNLLVQGYKGQVICTPATLALAEIILKDSALIQSKSLKRKINREKFSKRQKEPDNLFLAKQVNEAMEQFLTIAFNKRFEVREDLFVTFIPAGHLLGAANILIEVKEHNEWKKIIFSGDIGRKDYPILKDPQAIPQADYIICESTYGITRHQDEGKPENLLLDIVEKACVKIPGRLIIPAFSIGRTQSILYTLHKLSLDKKLPPVKIFADSPMAEASTKVYEKFPELLNEEAKKKLEKNQSLFDFENLVIIHTEKQSRQVSNYLEPCIIISSSGMLTGGRVESHLKANLANPYCTILMVGYTAEGTPGHGLLHKKTVNIKGRNLPVTARILRTDIFSGHGDQDDLLAFVKSQKKEKLKKIFLVHGEYDSMLGFKKLLEEEGYGNVEMPKKGETYIL
jgi:metallo-beta-lactamase family protein